MRNYDHLAVLTLMVIVVGAGGQMSEDECRSIGFSRPLCTSCDKLEAFELNKLEDLCQQCCIEDVQVDTGRRYPRAQLEVCYCMFPSLPQIEAFVKKLAPTVPHLTVKHVNGQPPIIKLFDMDGNVDRILSITKWNTETIQEFLNSHLLE